MEPNFAAIPRHLLADRYLTAKGKDALARGLCPACQQPLEVIDTWERACPNPACDYMFNLYHWPHVFAPFDPAQGIAPAPNADLSGAPEFLQQAITQTLREHIDQVVAWRAGTPKTWGFLAGKTVLMSAAGSVSPSAHNLELCRLTPLSCRTAYPGC